jgi:hypothetical protein
MLKQARTAKALLLILALFNPSYLTFLKAGLRASFFNAIIHDDAIMRGGFI